MHSTPPTLSAPTASPPPAAGARRLRFRLAAVISAAALAGALLPVVADRDSADAASVVLTATDAGWTTVRQPDSVQNHDYLSATATADRTYLKFSGAELEGQTVSSATLEVRVRSTTSTGPGLIASRTSTSWSSRTLTHERRPGAGPVVSERSETAQAGRLLRIPLDVSALSTTGDFALSLNHSQKGIRLLLEVSSEERRVGKECRTVCRSRWSPYH